MKKILVIEDNKYIRENTVQILELAHYEVKAAEKVASALEILKIWLPDLILCDVMLPDADGFEVLDQVRQNPATARVPFLFLTAINSAESRSQAREKGANEYLTKPFTELELLAALTRNLKTNKTENA